MSLWYLVASCGGLLDLGWSVSRLGCFHRPRQRYAMSPAITSLAMSAAYWSIFFATRGRKRRIRPAMSLEEALHCYITHGCSVLVKRTFRRCTAT